MRLIADIGGTNARFMMAAGAPASRWNCKVADHATFADALAAYLHHTAQPRIDEICIAVAGPVTAGAVRLTNAAWAFSEADLRDLTGAARVRLFNDLEAVALAIPHLGAACVAFDAGRPRAGKAGAPCLIVAPGTGLGVGLYVPPRMPGEAPQSFATEAGHARTALASGDVLQRLDTVLPACDHTPETFLSGPGLCRIDRAFNGTARAGAEIAAGALAGDARSTPVIAAFLDMLARFAGSAALIAGAFGGVYLAGGIIRGLMPIIDRARFRHIFGDHPPMQTVLEGVPLYLVDEADPALVALAAYRFT